MRARPKVGCGSGKTRGSAAVPDGPWLSSGLTKGTRTVLLNARLLNCPCPLSSSPPFFVPATYRLHGYGSDGTLIT
jgi:hypothetical protein